MTDISYIVAFGAGLLSFISPCVLPLVPAYLANLAGVTAIDNSSRKSYLPVLFHSLCFVLGFSIIFVGMGASVGLLGTTITAHSALLRQISGVVIILFGIFLIAAFKLPWLNYEKRLNPAVGSNPGYIRSIIIGAAFALGWTPCIGPILGAILAMAWSSQTVGQGALLLSVYSLGLGIPFVLIGLAWGTIAPLWKGINRHLGTISIISGILLILVGILILTGNLEWLTQLVPNLEP
ncbi:MAG: cytochrome c biogenesis protein CcdA [Chloroflexi bacterium]|nr:cytochrome c biogenesis protein CcdA [Chloroflexota bacterium]MBM3173828.1 cytochrome c biogenesis protein CcdA [Chloroflexota bacterium]MBM3175305.1 cytochrome c biogenesis protein CcdA [Chloroflexota bacterium]MBM4450161.1 cytochrome c biogenesis protein CcdA [Chloroflexota bacterium]